jgi:hypothetical protein
MPAMAGLLLVRVGVVAMVWHAHAVTLAELRAVIAAVPANATVFVASAPGEPPAARLSNGLRTDGHLPALLVIERRAWWPFMFDNDSQQPIHTRPPYQAMALRIGAMPDLASVDPASWCGFDFALVMGRPDRDVQGWREIHRNATAALFRVDHAECQTSSGPMRTGHTLGVPPTRERKHAA